jgi:hypothetical protein
VIATACALASIVGCSTTTELEGVAGTDESVAASTSTTSTSTTSTSTVPSSTTSTEAPVIDTTVDATAAPPPPAPPTSDSGPPADPLAPPQNLVEGDGAIALDAAFACEADPGIPGFTVVDCQVAPSHQNGVLTLVLSRIDSGALAFAVLFRNAGQWQQRFGANFEPEQLSGIAVGLEDLNGDDGVEVWVKYTYLGSGGFVDLEVIDPRPDGSVVLGGLGGVENGAVSLRPGGALTRNTLFASSDPGCCPSLVVHRNIFFRDGRWVIDAGESFPAASEPPVDFNL